MKIKVAGLLMVLVVGVEISWTGPASTLDNHHFLNSFAVQVDGGLEEAQAVASDLGFLVHRELPNIGVFLLTHPEVNHCSKRSADHHVSRLQSHPRVHYVQQEVVLERVKRHIVYDKQLELPIREIKDNSVYHREEVASVATRGYEDEVTFSDPCYKDMWYLDNHGQSGGERYLDMNIQVAWANGFSGEGVVVTILDDGVDHTHPDLADNYDPKASGDLNDKSDRMHDPMPNMTDPGNSHGTRCAGEIAAAANNDVCGVGVAYSAKIGGVRILDGAVTDALEGEALNFNSDYVDIYSASWGPNDDGRTMEAPHYFATQALKNGVLKGRGGLGSIYVWATGNGGMNGDDCNADGYTSSIESLSVGSITDWGCQPFYMENCTSTLAVVPTGGEEYRGQEADLGQIKLKVVTTDAGGGCIENFQGTSSAAPLGAGCLANVLQANPSLTWRDVQHVVVHGTRIPSADSSWTINGGGHHVSHKFGFGLMDCGKMVQVAQQWQNVPEQHVCQYHRNDPHHGTRCAGEIAAAANNDVCGVGVAYSAKIGGVRILDGAVTDALEGEALNFNSDYVDIYSASWGPNDDGRTMEAPHYFATQALKNGVLKGRGGLGSIYVWATGNGGMNGDDCNADGYTSSIESLSVGSITDWGRQPFYMENCTSTLAVVPTGGEEYRGQEADLGQIKLKVVTTDAGGGCIENFQGTSSAAPLGAGCLANVLQANPSLTWRDVQHVVVHGTRIPSADSSWTINGGGHHVSHKFGFGLMDCGKMVQVAQQWQNVPEQHVCQYHRNDPQKLEYGGVVSESLYVDACKGDKSKWIQRLEHVQVQLKLNSRRRGDTRIFLTSPSGTRSELLSTRPHDDHHGNWQFTFMTVHSWDEDPLGQWHLEIHDKPQQQSVDSSDHTLDKLKSALDSFSSKTQGNLDEWSLILYGTAGERYGRDFSSKPEVKKAYKPSVDSVQRMKRDETESARNVHVKRASQKRQNNKRTNAENQISDETINRLAKQLNSLLNQGETHKHVKRILENQPSPSAAKVSLRYQNGRQEGLNHQSKHSNSCREKKENLLNKILRSLEQLEKTERT